MFGMPMPEKFVVLSESRRNELTAWLEWRCDICDDVFAHCPERTKRLTPLELEYVQYIEEEVEK